MSIVKICEYCGEPFEARNSYVKICSRQHYSNCVICGKRFPISRTAVVNNGVKSTCSKECQKELVKRTNNERYGVDYPMSTEEFKEHVKETCMNKYGVTNPGAAKESIEKRINTMQTRHGVSHALQSEKFRSKAKETYQNNFINNIEAKHDLDNRRKSTMQELYGGNSPMESPILRSRIEHTNIERYGCTNPLGSKEIRDKCRDTMIHRYGSEYTLQSEELRSKVSSTMLERYGVEHPTQMDNYRDKVKSTMLDKYGVEHNSQIRMKLLGTLDTYMKFKQNPKEFILDEFPEFKPTAGMLSSKTGADISMIWIILHDSHCESLVEFGKKSSMEEDVIHELNQMNISCEIIRNTKQVINPYELDIFIPDKKFAIECNPTSTHNSSKSFFPDSDIMPKDYHKMKTDMCETLGIQLFHIFGYEWKYRREIIISMIQNMLGCTPIRIYARNCEIDMNVSYYEAKYFLEHNHRQGNTNARYRIGLRDKDKNLVCLMCFNKIRGTIGSAKYKQPAFELSRFCSLLNTSVLGGASKLFKHFINSIEFKTIISYSDRAHTSGNLYRQLGFQKLHVSDPNYVWVKSSDDTYYNRLSTQKNRLKRLLNDDSIDLNLTERQIMENHGYLQVFDSGTITWIFQKDI